MEAPMEFGREREVLQLRVRTGEVGGVAVGAEFGADGVQSARGGCPDAAAGAGDDDDLLPVQAPPCGETLSHL
jgi:hypothetical protein